MKRVKLKHNMIIPNFFFFFIPSDHIQIIILHFSTIRRRKSRQSIRISMSRPSRFTLIPAFRSFIPSRIAFLAVFFNRALFSLSIIFKNRGFFPFWTFIDQRKLNSFFCFFSNFLYRIRRLNIFLRLKL